MVEKQSAVGVSRGTTRKKKVAATVQERLSSRTASVVEALGGVRATARIMGVDPAQVSRWRSGETFPGPDSAKLLLDIDHVVGMAELVWDRSLVADWLAWPNSHLRGARPIDVVRLEGSAEVVMALRAEAAGAFA